MSQLKQVKDRLDIVGEEEDAILRDCLGEASRFISEYTGCASVPDPLERTLVRITILMYRRGITKIPYPRAKFVRYLPQSILELLNAYRMINEAEKAADAEEALVAEDRA
jgi:hypothetical protein